ncbi:NINE protein [Amylibacter sp.]|nr:NINE protein [Amylibacter sp.]
MSKEVNINTGNEKNLIITLLLWFFLGYGIGAHNFYLGRKGIGITQVILFISSWLTFFLGIGLIIFGILGIWWLIDIIYVFKLSNNSTVVSVNASNNSSHLDELDKLHKLFENGVLTKEQYENKKNKILQFL